MNEKEQEGSSLLESEDGVLEKGVAWEYASSDDPGKVSAQAGEDEQVQLPSVDLSEDLVDAKKKHFDGYDTGSGQLLLSDWASFGAPSGQVPQQGRQVSASGKGGRFYKGSGPQRRVLLFVGVVLAVLVVATSGGIALARMMSGFSQQQPVVFRPRLPQPVSSVSQATPSPRVQVTPGRTPVAQPQPKQAPAGIVGPPDNGNEPVPPRPSLLQDNFQRNADIPTGWGVASLAGGQAWRLLSGDPAAFSVVGNTGQIVSINELGAGFYTATLGSVPAGADQDIVATFTMWGFGGQTANMGVLAGWQDQGSYYKAYVDGTNLVIMRNVNGQQALLGSAPFPAQDGVTYSLRFDVVEGQALAKVWDITTQSEPANWMVHAPVGASTVSGQPGLRTYLQAGSLVAVAAFQVVVNPTHVPVMPQHF